MKVSTMSILTNALQVPHTQGIKYAGSKLKLLPYILEWVAKTKVDRVFDGFSGSTRVSQALVKSGYQVTSNDLSEWSFHFANAYLKNTNTPHSYQALIDHLNNLKPEDGWFTQQYGGDPEKSIDSTVECPTSKKPWQIKNTRKLDAIREEIDKLKLDPLTHSVALSSLMLALDEVDSTLGHHASYLREWAPRAFNELRLKVPNLWINKQQNDVTKGDVFKAIQDVNCDLAYFDPPYGSNNDKMPPSRVRYGAYYHLWTTVCLNDRPDTFGKANRRVDSSDKVSSSVFEDFRKLESGQFVVVDAIERLIKQTPCEWILLSYSSGGRATAQQLNDCISSHGELVNSLELDYRRHVMASMQSTRNWIRDDNSPNREYLFLIRKKK